MNLRNEFAARAMQSLIIAYGDKDWSIEQIAETAYIYSDIMMDEKESSKRHRLAEKKNQILFKKIDQLELSVRSYNALKNKNAFLDRKEAIYVADLVTRSEFEMLAIENFGRKSLNEVRQLLFQHGLNFRMKLTENQMKKLAELPR